MKNFELKTWMTENRELVIAQYRDLEKEKFFSGISMRDFGIKVFRGMQINNPRSPKRAASLLPHVMGNIYVNECAIGGNEVTPSFSINNEASKRQLPSSMR